MPFLFDEAAGFLNVTARGRISGADLLQLHSDLATEAELHAKCIIDFTEADVSKLTGPIVQRLSRLPPRFGRLAIVAKPGIAYVLGRTYQAAAHGERTTIGLFTTAENATAWLLHQARQDRDASARPRLRPASAAGLTIPPARTG